jgi:hypothetical protein
MATERTMKTYLLLNDASSTINDTEKVREFVTLGVWRI